MKIEIKKTVLQVLSGRCNRQFISRIGRGYTRDLSRAYLFNDKAEALKWGEINRYRLVSEHEVLVLTTYSVHMVAKND